MRGALCCPLPITLPVPANRRTHGVRHHDMSQSAVIRAAVILQPCGVVRVLVQIAGADVVVLPADHTTQAREERLRHVGVLAMVAVDFGVVHTVHHPASVQQVPMGRFIR